MVYAFYCWAPCCVVLRPRYWAAAMVLPSANCGASARDSMTLPFTTRQWQSSPARDRSRATLAPVPSCLIMCDTSELYCLMGASGPTSRCGGAGQSERDRAHIA